MGANYNQYETKTMKTEKGFANGSSAPSVKIMCWPVWTLVETPAQFFAAFRRWADQCKEDIFLSSLARRARQRGRRGVVDGKAANTV